MSARWSDAPPFAWTDDARAKPTAGYGGLVMPDDTQGGLLRGVVYAVAFQAALLALLALLVLIIVLAEHAL